jgi:hypothetical protein
MSSVLCELLGLVLGLVLGLARKRSGAETLTEISSQKLTVMPKYSLFTP